MTSDIRRQILNGLLIGVVVGLAGASILFITALPRMRQAVSAASTDTPSPTVTPAVELTLPPVPTPVMPAEVIVTVPPTQTPEPSPTPLPTPEPLTYTVQSGDTLSQIAERFGVTTDAMMEANNFTNDYIEVGDVLLIPQHGEAFAEPTATSAPSAADEALSHTVTAGETLGGIAARYGVPIEDIQRANDLDSVDDIYAGQVLVIPTPEPTPRSSQ